MLSDRIASAATEFARMITLNDLERRLMLFMECVVIVLSYSSKCSSQPAGEEVRP